MDKHHFNLKKPLLAALLALAPVSGYSAGFALFEQSASGMGTAFSSGSAGAEDATTIYFNPAGLTYIEGTQFIAAGHYIVPSANFTNDSSKSAVPIPPFPGSLEFIDGGNGGSAGESGFVPNLYYARSMDNGWKFGLGINVPFGLSTKYDSDWVGRYHAIESAVSTLNINPNFAFKPNDKLSIGFGVSAMYLEATLSNAIDIGLICAGAGIGACTNPLNNDGQVSIEGDSWGYGFNVGLMYQLSSETRIGAAYRSNISHDLDGDADFTTPANAATLIAVTGGGFSDTDASTEINLPETLSVGISHEVNTQWTFLADLLWTKWSRLDKLVIEFDSAHPDNKQTFDWNNSLKYSAGLIFQKSTRLKYRFGLGFDETPVPDADTRTPRIPGNDRTWLAFGVGYQFQEDLSFDVGLVHVFVSDTKISNAEENTGHTLIGEYESDVNIISAQLNWKF